MTFDTNEKLRLVTGKGLWHTVGIEGKIRSIQVSDGPHGLRNQKEGEAPMGETYLATCYPTASCVCASFDENLISKMAAAIADEAKEKKISVVLGPGMNIKRSPLCGRNFEYFSEDPYLTGVMASAYVKGMQNAGTGTCIKHFAANSQETHRNSSNSIVDERALREIYLAAFEKCVKEAKPASIMASYNYLNDVQACENKWLLTDVLRDEWGFEGLIMSDWGACTDIGACVKAGMDLEMPDSNGYGYDELQKAYMSGQVSECDLDRAVSKLYQISESYAFDNEERAERTESKKKERHLLGRQIASQSAVLLKNDGILPFDNKEEYVVIGAMAENLRFQGGGSSHINTDGAVNILRALSAYGVLYKYAKGYNDGAHKSDETLEKEALKLAMEAQKEGKKIIFCGGLTDYAESEGYDRRTYEMPYNQVRLFKKLKEICNDIVFVSFGGAAYDISVCDYARGVLMMYLGGEAAGEACVDILFGSVNPSGHLPETYPYTTVNDGNEHTYPANDFFGRDTDNVEYRESIFVGYRYYNTFGEKVRFPFGFGLSYTSFEYRSPEVMKLEDGRYRVDIVCRNTGKRDGSCTPQLYIGMKQCPDFLRPKRELKGFKKVFLKAEESKKVTFFLDERSFSIYDSVKGKWVVPEGEYEIMIGENVEDIVLSETVTLNGAKVDLPGKNDIPSYFTDGKAHGIRPSYEDFITLIGRNYRDFDHIKKGEYTTRNSLRQLCKTAWWGKILLWVLENTTAKISQKPKDSPDTLMMIEFIHNMCIKNVVTMSDGRIDMSKADAFVEYANGNRKKAIRLLFKGNEKV